jgi:hypothetical protein
MSKNEIMEKQQNELMENIEAPLGFEDEEKGDMIIPRVKIVQTLSPERKDKIAEEGDIINSLTKEKLNGKVFIPVFKFNSNIEWRPRSEGGGIVCIARDGKIGVTNDGSTKICKQCRRNKFDNSKQGKDAIPKCTKYINFFGFMEDSMIPIIISFGKTNYNEGRKLYSLAKVTMQNMWNHKYTLQEKLMSKNGNEWYIIDVVPAGPTTEEQRAHGSTLYKQFRYADLNVDTEEETDPTMASDEEIKSVEF